MAHWRITRRPDGHLELDYRRPGTLGVRRAGTLHAWTSSQEVLAWILNQEVTTTGDIVTLHDGGALQILPLAPAKV